MQQFSNKCAPRGFQNSSYRKENFKDSLITVLNVLLSSGGSAGVLWKDVLISDKSLVHDASALGSSRLPEACRLVVAVAADSRHRLLTLFLRRRRYSRLRKDSVTTRRLPITRTPSLISSPPAHSKQPYWSLHACHFGHSGFQHLLNSENLQDF